MKWARSKTRTAVAAAAMVVAFLAAAAAGEPEARRRSRGRGRTSSETDPDPASARANNSKLRKGFNVDMSKVANETTDDRNAKFFPIFNIVQFKNDPCQSNAGVTGSGNQRNGTCYTVTECQDRGGTSSGNCAAGFGVCCLFQVKNGDSVSENCTYIQNPSFPASDTASTSISHTVRKCNNDVCFLRLDFETFTLQGVGGTAVIDEGVCLDMFTVTTPTSQGIPSICGANTGYHMYIDIGANSGDTATLAFTFAGTSTQRTWDIKVTQVECTNGNAPPDTCLQYHTGTTGRIETFNYQATNDNHLNNQEYTVCIRPECGFCCVQYMLCADQPAAEAFSLDTSIASSANDDLCLTTDYVAIPESSSIGNCAGAANSGARQVNSRYCGVNLNFLAALTVNEGICDCTAPFTVDIFTDNTADPMTTTGTMNTIFSRGLCLEYTQVPC